MIRFLIATAGIYAMMFRSLFDAALVLVGLKWMPPVGEARWK